MPRNVDLSSKMACCNEGYTNRACFKFGKYSTELFLATLLTSRKLHKQERILYQNSILLFLFIMYILAK